MTGLGGKEIARTLFSSWADRRLQVLRKPFEMTEPSASDWGIWCLVRGGAEGWLGGYGPSDKLTEAVAKAAAARFTSQIPANVSDLVTYTAKRA